jgi:RNA polymerase sigma factor (sigma-70 family)
MIAEHEGTLKRTARRYSLDVEDAEDAYQRALEIALTKAPTTDPRELIRWTQTVTKHEALALRQSRERLLGYGARTAPGDTGVDPVALIPATGDSPEEQVERREAIARSREALRALKPAELRALSLLAEGYSYAEIGELTGFSQTKINRVLAEGRDRFRGLVSSSEDGSRCRQLGPLLSAFCDGEASPRDSEAVREHLRACGHCRSTMRTYRAAPRIAVALAPALPQSRSLLERVQDLLAGLSSRLPGIGAGGGDSAATQIAVGGGSRGVGMVALAKVLALCAGAAGGAACVATGVLPTPDLTPPPSRKAGVVRPAARPSEAQASEAVQYEPAPAPAAAPQAEPEPEPSPAKEPQSSNVEAPTGAVEYEPPPATAPESAAPSGGEASSSGSAAGEFGP